MFAKHANNVDDHERRLDVFVEMKQSDVRNNKIEFVASLSKLLLSMLTT